MATKSVGYDPTERPTSTPKCSIGFEFERDLQDGNGPQVWVYVQNDAASALVVGNLCSRKAGSTTKVVVKSPTSSDPQRVIGVAQHAFPASYYGFILRKGRGLVLADTGNITADTGIIPGNAVAGAADSSGGVTATAMGWAPVAITAAATGYAIFDCRG